MFVILRKIFSYTVATIACIGSLMAVMNPVVNAFALMSLGIPAVALMITETLRYKLELILEWIC